MSSRQPGLIRIPALIVEVMDCRIILAFDLEIWYLQSLKFAMALKFLGPQLVMLKNMVGIELVWTGYFSRRSFCSFAICSLSCI